MGLASRDFVRRAVMRCAGQAALLLSMLFSAGVAHADRIPGWGEIPEGFYFTTDMSPVRIEFWPNLMAKSTDEPLAVVQMPRAYIYLTSHHSQKHYPDLPSDIEAETVSIMLIYPDGLPYSVALAQRDGAVPIEEAAATLRPVLLTATLQASGINAYESEAFEPLTAGGYETYVGDYGDLRRYTTPGSNEVYFGSRGDLIRKIRCSGSAESANANFLCEYYTVLSEQFVAKLRFLDFRAHGGLGFAEERVRAFKATICAYFECD